MFAIFSDSMTTFADLLNEHLRSGTRPGLSGEGQRWSLVEFAKATGSTDRTVRNWKTGHSLPAKLEEIERALFGSEQTTSRVALREAWSKATSSVKQPLRPERDTLSNIPVNVPRHFLGRENDIEAIKAAFNRDVDRNRIAALYGMRGVGKTTLAAAYAERCCKEYRATWWIRAHTESTMRADLVGLGVQLGWLPAEAAEDPAVTAVLERLRRDGEGILLIFDNASNASEIRNYLPRAPGPQVIVTSTAPNWSGLASALEVRIWSSDVGADFLIARTSRVAERKAALDLSEALGGLPLAHEQASAYCERVGVSLAEYTKRFETASLPSLDAEYDASLDYYGGLTVAKTFARAIDEATKLHPAAESLIIHAALLAPVPIPLYLFSDVPEQFGEPLAQSLANHGLDEAVAALRAFALIDRQSIPDERDPTVATDCISLHPLVRQVAATRRSREARSEIRRRLIEAVVEIYPKAVQFVSDTWSRARRLDAIGAELIANNENLPVDSDLVAARLMGNLAAFRQTAPMVAYAEAQLFVQHALAITENAAGADLETATNLNALGFLLRMQDDRISALPYLVRAVAIREARLGSDHPETALSLNNLGCLLQDKGDLAEARLCYERALAINEKTLDPEHPYTANSLNNLGCLLLAQKDDTSAQPYLQRAISIYEKALGAGHRDVMNLGYVSQAWLPPKQEALNRQMPQDVESNVARDEIEEKKVK
jgi:tetratricopeptide (TPR) repeat protein